MALSGVKLRGSGHNYWPGFVDMMVSMVLVLIFLLSMFMSLQFFLSREIHGKDAALEKLRSEIMALTSLLSMARTEQASLERKMVILKANLSVAEKERNQLQAHYDTQKAKHADSLSKLQSDLTKEKEKSHASQKTITLLNKQLSALRNQLSMLSKLLEDTQEKEQKSQKQIKELGLRLNIALAQKVQRLSQYRSEFFGRLRRSLGNRPDIHISGDRFLLESGILFATGSATLSPGGQKKVAKLAGLVLELERKIPSDIPWILRVDGHTDARPIRSTRFPSNWELSSARAIAVVRHLISNGVSPDRLVAAGFGENRPLVQEIDAESRRKNRRIELKLTE